MAEINQCTQSIEDFKYGHHYFDVTQARELREQLASRFTDYYDENGYQIIPGVPISSKIDRTTVFVGSTISPVKREVFSGSIATPGIAIYQPCLRTQGVAKLFNDAKVPTFNTYFHQLGVFAPSGSFGRVLSEAVVFLLNYANISRERLKIHISTNDVDMVQAARELGYEDMLIFDIHEDQEYYRWEYGEEGVRGRGLTFEVQALNGKRRDIGNAVIIEDLGGNQYAVEWGFGIETLISAIYGNDKPMQNSVICSVIPYQDGLWAKLIDTLSTVAIIYGEGIEPGANRSERWVLSEYVKGLYYLATKLGVNMEQIESWLELYAQKEGLMPGIGRKFVEYIDQYLSRIERFKKTAKNLIKSNKKQKMKDLPLTLSKVALNFGLTETEREEVIAQLLSEH